MRQIIRHMSPYTLFFTSGIIDSMAYRTTDKSILIIINEETRKGL